MKKKLVYSILYFVLCFITIISGGIVFSAGKASQKEVVAAYTRQGCRVEYEFSSDDKPFKINESNNANVKYLIDKDEQVYAKIYYESGYDEKNKPIIIGDNPTKVLLSDSLNNNYFNVDLIYGTYPDSSSFIVSEKIANYFDINKDNLPKTISYECQKNGEYETKSLIVCGVFKNSDNKYITKPDCKGNECSNYVIIGQDSDNMELFSSFIDIVEYLRSDELSNAYILLKIMPRLGGIMKISAYDDFSYESYNENFTNAVIGQRNVLFTKELVINNNKIFVPILIVSTVALIALAIYMMTKYFDERKVKFNLFHLTFISFIIPTVVAFVLKSFIIYNKVLFFSTIFSSSILVIFFIALFAALLFGSIILDDKYYKKTTKQKIEVIESAPDGLVSIIIPTYNGSDYLECAIKSALNQTYKNTEIIVVDDGSNDGDLTSKIIDKYSNKIKYFKKDNGGVSSALNYGISKAKGNYINWLSHDDELSPNSIAERISVSCWASNEKTIPISKVEYIDENGKKITRVAAGVKEVDSYSRLLGSTINGCSVLIPRKVFDSHKFKEGVVFMPDYLLWAELIADGYKFKPTRAKCVKSRIHKQQITIKHEELHEKDFAIFAKEFIEPLFKNKDYNELRKIMMVLSRRLKLHPFYEATFLKIKNYLKEEKQFDFIDSFEILLNKLFGNCVSLARKITSK